MKPFDMKKLDVRIYYEDTDHGGVVYHANYLKYMERGRTEWLRTWGFEQSELAKKYDVLFALTRSDIRYRSPARFDDLLTVHTHLLEAKGARMQFGQKIYHGDRLLVEGDIHLACMNAAGKPKRIPQSLLDRINKEKS